MDIDFIMAYEDGILSPDEQIAGFAAGITSGMVWQLQGSYGRMAHGLIRAGYISQTGEILRTAEDED